MTNDSTNPDSDPLTAVVTALRNGGPRTAGQLAEYMGIAYSSLTPRLRQLEADGRAERVKDPQTRVTIWQTITTAADGDTADSNPNPSPTEADETADAPDMDAPIHASAASDGIPPLSRDVEPEPAAEPAPESEPELAPEPELESAPEPEPGPGPDLAHEANESAPTSGELEPGDDTGLADTDPAPDTDGAGDDHPTEAKSRRPHGTIPAAILALTRAHPDTTFKVSQLSKALDGASEGAIANAAHKLVTHGELLLVIERPATFQAA